MKLIRAIVLLACSMALASSSVISNSNVGPLGSLERRAKKDDDGKKDENSKALKKKKKKGKKGKKDEGIVEEKNGSSKTEEGVEEVNVSSKKSKNNSSKTEEDVEEEIALSKNVSPKTEEDAVEENGSSKKGSSKNVSLKTEEDAVEENVSPKNGSSKTEEDVENTAPSPQKKSALELCADSKDENDQEQCENDLAQSTKTKCSALNGKDKDNCIRSVVNEYPCFGLKVKRNIRKCHKAITNQCQNDTCEVEKVKWKSQRSYFKAATHCIKDDIVDYDEIMLEDVLEKIYEDIKWLDERNVMENCLPVASMVRKEFVFREERVKLARENEDHESEEGHEKEGDNKNNGSYGVVVKVVEAVGGVVKGILG